VWVTSESDGTVRRVNPRKNRVSAKIKAGSQPNGVVYAFGAIWVGDLGGGRVLKIEVRRNKVVARYPVPQADWITPSADALWVSGESNEVVRLDPATGAITAHIPVGHNPLASAWIAGELWVPNIDDGTISVIDPATNAVRTTFPAGTGTLAVTETAGDAWVSASNDGEIWRIRP
jgi:YVTN family beta-propeller protein